MKKTIKTLALIVITIVTLLTLTGCANVNYEIKLNKDGSGDVSYILGYDKSFLSSMGVTTESLENDDSLDEMKEEAQEQGFTVTQYEDDNTYGFKATKHIDKISEFKLNDTMTTGEASNDNIGYEKNLLKTKYYQAATLDLSNDTDDEEDAQTAAIANSLLSQMKISYKIELPFKAGENNATTVSEDGKVLEWNLKFGSVNEIKFEAEQDNTLYIVGGAIVLLVLVIIIVVMCTKKGKTKQNVESKKEEKVEEVKPEVNEVNNEEVEEDVKEELTSNTEEEIKEESDEEVEVNEDAVEDKEETSNTENSEETKEDNNDENKNEE